MRPSLAGVGEAARAPEHAPSRRRKPRPSVLPPTLPPHGLSREQAAEFWGCSPTLFDRGVRDGIIPKPYTFYGRRLWDRRKLEGAFAALDTEPDDAQPWGKMAL